MAENNANFTIQGIDSKADIQTIENELDKLEGVMGAQINGESSKESVKYDVDVLAEERIKITVREMGYDVE